MTYIYKSSTWKTKKKKLFGILSKLHTSTDGAKEKLQFQIGSYLEPKYLWRTAKNADWIFIKSFFIFYKYIFILDSFYIYFIFAYLLD